MSKITDQLIPPLAQPHQLQTDPERHANRIPWLYGEFNMAVPQSLTLVLRIHNQAGIPIIEGQSRVEAGQRQFTFQELRAIGIEAYAHLTEAERWQISHRIWSRRAYSTLAFLILLEGI